MTKHTNYYDIDLFHNNVRLTFFSIVSNTGYSGKTIEVDIMGPFNMSTCVDF